MNEEVGCLSRFRDAFGCDKDEFLSVFKKQEEKEEEK